MFRSKKKKCPSGKCVFYIPHMPIVKQSTVTTKVPMVFDASDKPQPLTNSINDCMFTGSPLQPLLWNIMVRVGMSSSLPGSRFTSGNLMSSFLKVKACQTQARSLDTRGIKMMTHRSCLQSFFHKNIQ